MIDIKLVRANPAQIRKGIENRGGRYLPVFDGLISKDEKYKALLSEVEKLRAKRNEISQSIGKHRADKNASSAQSAMEEANKLKDAMQSKEAELAGLKSEIDDILLGLPNIPHESVPLGKSEADNKIVRENISAMRKFSFKPMDHQEIGEKLGILDFNTAALLSGSRFALLCGAGARLERAIINFMLDFHGKNGYREIFPPFIVTAETMTGTGQLPKFEEDLYKICGEPPMYLIPTAEVPLTNMFRGQTLKESQLPMKFAAHSACFRQEAGSYGKDTRGLIRNHQFNKVELVWMVKPEDSMSALEQLTADAEAVLNALEIPHRVISLCTGDIGFASCKTYDIEVWMPSENRFREISSCSNCGDFQARRMNTRFKRDKATEFIHTLNGSGVAVGRTFAAILENFQNEDGSVSVPKVLIPYFGADKIES